MAYIGITETNPFTGATRALTFHGETIEDTAVRTVNYIESRLLSQRHTFVIADGGWGSLAGDVDQAAADVRQAIEWRDQERSACEV